MGQEGHPLAVPVLELEQHGGEVPKYRGSEPRWRVPIPQA